MQWAATVHQAGVSQRKGLSGQASQSHRLRKGVADLRMRSASTVHGLLQRSDDDTTSNNTKEGQPTDFLNLPPPPLRAANRGRHIGDDGENLHVVREAFVVLSERSYVVAA